MGRVEGEGWGVGWGLGGKEREGKGEGVGKNILKFTNIEGLSFVAVTAFPFNNVFFSFLFFSFILSHLYLCETSSFVRMKHYEKIEIVLRSFVPS